jgi:Protein of unknown function (DUF4238)
MLHISAAELVIGAAAGKGDKHHYIPVFYSRGWAGANGLVCEYSRPHDAVKAKRVSPDGTGYVRGLYTVPKHDPSLSNYIERDFFRITDNAAACVLQKFRSGQPIEWTIETRSAWSRFIISLMIRNPEYVAKVAAEVVGFFHPSSGAAAKYREIRTPDDPETYEEFVAKAGHPAGRASALAMQTIIDSPAMGGRLNEMRWTIIGFKNETHSLLTSDRPIIMTNGLVKPNDHLAMPIGPRQLFLATNTMDTERAIMAMGARSVMGQVNERVTSQARRYVYGIDDSQLRFVRNRLGRRFHSTPLDTIGSLNGCWNRINNV